MSVELTPALAVGLLAQSEPLAAKHAQALREAQTRAKDLSHALREATARYMAHRDAMRRFKEEGQAAANVISANNTKLGRLHQQSDALRRRADELLQAFKQSTDPMAQAQLRRSRAEVMVTLEDRQKTLKALGATVEQARAARQHAQHESFALQESERALVRELDALQAQLPEPHLFFDLFEATAACSHCNFVLDRNRNAWITQLTLAIDPVFALHGDLKAGRYRLDKNSAYVGGRALATAEAMYACVAMEKPRRAVRLFQLATDPELFFHQIFHVFRAWCLGLYLQSQHEALYELATMHQFTEGVSGAYANAFLALLQRDPLLWQHAMRSLVQGEWQASQRHRIRGLGLVNVNAVALCQLGKRVGMPALNLGPQVPPELV